MGQPAVPERVKQEMHMTTRESFLTPPRLGLILALLGAIVALLAFVLLPHSTEYVGTFPLRPVSGLQIALGGGEACSPSSPPPCLLTGISRQPFPSSLLWAEPLLALFLAGTEERRGY